MAKNKNKEGRFDYTGNSIREEYHKKYWEKNKDKLLQRKRIRYKEDQVYRDAQRKRSAEAYMNRPPRAGVERKPKTYYPRLFMVEGQPLFLVRLCTISKLCGLKTTSFVEWGKKNIIFTVKVNDWVYVDFYTACYLIFNFEERIGDYSALDDATKRTKMRYYRMFLEETKETVGDGITIEEYSDLTDESKSFLLERSRKGREFILENMEWLVKKKLLPSRLKAMICKEMEK